MTRPRFRERQRVTAAELAAEQAYLVGAARRHRIGEHTWGIVSGLALAARLGGVAVQPGVAVDGFGRELVVPATVSVPAAALEALEADTADVWLLYGRVADAPAQRRRWECGPGRHRRWSESPCLRVTVADGTLDPREPPGVGADSLAFTPSDDPPDTSAPVWPVLLGSVTHTDAGYDIDPSRRPYAGLAGEQITHPSGSDELRIGGSPAGFAVRTRDAAGTFAEPVVVDRDGNTTLTADTSLGGDLVLGGAASDRSGVAFTPLGAEPAAAAPWRAYRTSSGATNQLRLEIEHPAATGDPQGYALSVGSADAAGTFARGLTITSECVVAVTGDVHVEGVLRPGPIRIDADDPRFRTALLDRWVRGIAEASHDLGTVFAGNLTLGTVALTPNHPAGTVGCTVTASNPGTVLLPAVTVTATVVRNGAAQVTDVSLEAPFTLAPGASHALATTFGPMFAGTVVVTIRARATAPGNYQLAATASATTELLVIIT